MKFSSQIFFNHINHGYRPAVLKENYLWLLPFYRVVAATSIIKRCAERCVLQWYQTSLRGEKYGITGHLFASTGTLKTYFWTCALGEVVKEYITA